MALGRVPDALEFLNASFPVVDSRRVGSLHALLRNAKFKMAPFSLPSPSVKCLLCVCCLLACAWGWGSLQFERQRDLHFLAGWHFFGALQFAAAFNHFLHASTDLGHLLREALLSGDF